MKRLLSCILVVALLFCMCACENMNSEATGDSQDIPESSRYIEDANNTGEKLPDPDTTTITQEPPTESQDVTFAYNEDLSVVTAFAYDSHTYIVVENVGEQPILNFKVAYIHFDKNGFVATTDSDGYEVGRYDTVNLMPGNKTIGEWYGADGDYVAATIVAVDYADGKTWETSQIDSWVKTTQDEFSVDNYKSEIAALKEMGALAETNEFATLTGFL